MIYPKSIKRAMPEAWCAPDSPDTSWHANFARYFCGEFRWQRDRYPWLTMCLADDLPVPMTVTRTLRKDGFRGPIVALTAFSMAEDRDRCLQAGCDHYVQKPINTKTFLTGLQNILQYSSAQPEQDQY